MLSTPRSFGTCHTTSAHAFGSTPNSLLPSLEKTLRLLCLQDKTEVLARENHFVPTKADAAQTCLRLRVRKANLDVKVNRVVLSRCPAADRDARSAALARTRVQTQIKTRKRQEISLTVEGHFIKCLIYKHYVVVVQVFVTNECVADPDHRVGSQEQA